MEQPSHKVRLSVKPTPRPVLRHNSRRRQKPQVSRRHKDKKKNRTKTKVSILLIVDDKRVIYENEYFTCRLPI